jgi:hypothetical protein
MIKRNMKIIRLLLLFSVFHVQGFSQSPSGELNNNYIFLFDCTRSMTDLNLWDKAKEHLSGLIENIYESNSTITVIAFQKEIYKEIYFTAADRSSRLPYVIKALDSVINHCATNTNICTAWDRGVEIIRKNQDKYNYLFLITDGENNVNPATGAKDVINGKSFLLERLHNFCTVKNHTTVSFFVALTKDAALGNNAPNCIEQINSEYWENMVTLTPLKMIKSSDDFRNNNTVSQTVFLSKNKSGKINIESNDDFFDISIRNNEFINGEATLDITNKQPLTSDVFTNGSRTVSVIIKSIDEKQIRITTEQLSIAVTQSPVRTLEINTPPVVNMEKVEYYPAFLWTDEKAIQKLDAVIPLAFNQAAKTNDASVEFTIKSDGKDFDFYYNETFAMQYC